MRKEKEIKFQTIILNFDIEESNSIFQLISVEDFENSLIEEIEDLISTANCEFEFSDLENGLFTCEVDVSDLSSERVFISVKRLSKQINRAIALSIKKFDHNAWQRFVENY
jgi:hypothetical protein